LKNLVVAKQINGNLIKGFTRDFNPKTEVFHIIDEHEPADSKTVAISNLKALFFVRSTAGNKDYIESSDIDRSKYGKAIEVQFDDGEIITGYAQIYHPHEKGFFMFPSDPKSNNERIFINKSATKQVRFL
jgi:hypothetical protein